MARSPPGSRCPPANQDAFQSPRMVAPCFPGKERPGTSSTYGHRERDRTRDEEELHIPTKLLVRPSSERASRALFASHPAGCRGSRKATRNGPLAYGTGSTTTKAERAMATLRAVSPFALASSSSRYTRFPHRGNHTRPGFRWRELSPLPLPTPARTVPTMSDRHERRKFYCLGANRPPPNRRTNQSLERSTSASLDSSLPPPPSAGKEWRGGGGGGGANGTTNEDRVQGCGGCATAKHPQAYN